MQISIVTPVFNEAESIPAYWKAVSLLNCGKKTDFEVVVVNDGSSDFTMKVLKKLQNKSKIRLKIVDLKRNLGRSMARVAGARVVINENILFLDVRCEIFPDALKMIEKINYSPINPLVLQKKNSFFDLFFYIIRRAFYRKNFGEDFSEQFITAENFDSMAKGTTMFYCEKKLFLESQPSNIENKNNSDDTALLANIVKKRPILATSLVRCYYNTRSSFVANVKHIFNRGPKFVDYYYKPSKRHFWLINLFFLLIFLLIYRMYLGLISLYGLASVFLVVDAFLALYVSRKLKEFFIFLFFFPIFSAVFFLGVMRGFTLKVLGEF